MNKTAARQALDKLLIEGGTTLSGKVTISGAKNAALPILAGTLLASENVRIDNVPHLKDVTTMLSLLQIMGVQVTIDDQLGVEIDASRVDRSRGVSHVGRSRCHRWLAPTRLGGAHFDETGSEGLLPGAVFQRPRAAYPSSAAPCQSP